MQRVGGCGEHKCDGQKTFGNHGGRQAIGRMLSLAGCFICILHGARPLIVCRSARCYRPLFTFPCAHTENAEDAVDACPHRSLAPAGLCGSSCKRGTQAEQGESNSACSIDYRLWRNRSAASVGRDAQRSDRSESIFIISPDLNRYLNQFVKFSRKRELGLDCRRLRGYLSLCQPLDGAL